MRLLIVAALLTVQTGCVTTTLWDADPNVRSSAVVEEGSAPERISAALFNERGQILVRVAYDDGTSKDFLCVPADSSLGRPAGNQIHENHWPLPVLAKRRFPGTWVPLAVDGAGAQLRLADHRLDQCLPDGTYQPLCLLPFEPWIVEDTTPQPWRSSLAFKVGLTPFALLADLPIAVLIVPWSLIGAPGA